MVLSNYHTHSCFCDGYGEPADYVEAALDKGFYAIGFSSHVPLPFKSEWSMDWGKLPRYIESINELKRLYEGRIKIYLSLEMDYIQDLSLPAYNSCILEKLDYVVGSVHFLKLEKTGRYLNIDGSAENYRRILEEEYNGSIKAMVSGYYKAVSEMVKAYRPCFAAHLDLIKKNNTNNRFFSEDESWYHVEAVKVLKTLAEYGCALEVNTGGMARAGLTDIYPSKWMLKECKALGISLVLNSDAHRLEQLDAFYEYAQKELLEAGYEQSGTELICGGFSCSCFR